MSFLARIEVLMPISITISTRSARTRLKRYRPIPPNGARHYCPIPGNYFHLTIEGHADERGSEEYNLGLGDARAKAAKAYLVQVGIPDAQLHGK